MEWVARRFAWIAPIAGFLLPFALAAVLLSEWGRERLRTELVGAVNDSVQGTLDVGEVTIGPGLALTAHRVRLVTPEGEPALDTDRARVALKIGSLARGRLEVMIRIRAPRVDLTPDVEGKAALLRALAPDEKREDAGGELKATVAVLVNGGRVVRDREDAFDLGAIDFLLRMDSYGERTKLWLDGSGTLEKPGALPVALHTEIELDDAGVIVRHLRAIAGKSRLMIAEAEWTGDPATSGGAVLASVHPDDVRLFAPSLTPAAPIDVRASAVPIDGVLHAAAAASMEGGGEATAELRRLPDGSLTGAAALGSLVPAKWGWTASPATSVTAIASFARAPDGRLAARIDGAPIELREARVDRLTVTVARAPDGAVDATLTDFTARDGAGRWRLEKPARLRTRGAAIEVERIAISGPWGQRVLAEGRWPPLPARPLRVEVTKLAMHGLPGRIFPTLDPLAGFVDARVRLDSHDREGAPEGTVEATWRDASWGTMGPADLRLHGKLANGRARAFLDATAHRGERLRLGVDGPMRIPTARDHVDVIAVVTGLEAGNLEDVSAVVKAGIDHGRTWIAARATDEDRVLFRIAGTTTGDWSALAVLPPEQLLRRLPPAALTVADLDLSALAAAGLLPIGTEGKVSGMAAVVNGALSAHLTSTRTRAGPMQDLSLSAALRESGGELTASLLVNDASGGAAAAGAHATYDLRDLLRGKVDSLRWSARIAVADLGIGEVMGSDAAPRTRRPEPGITGRLDAAVAITGRGMNPRGWLWARAPDFRMKEKRFGRILVASRVSDDGAVAWLATSPFTGGKLAFVARLAGDPSRWITEPGAWRSAGLFAALAADGVSLAPYGDFLERVRRIDGTLQARAVVHGTPGAPDPIAKIAVTNGTVDTREIGRLRGIDILADASSRKVQLTRLVARGRDGVFTASVVAVRGRDAWRLSGGITSKDFSVRGEQFSGKIDGSGTVSGEVKYPNVDATLKIASAVVFLPQQGSPELQPLGPHPDVVVLAVDEPEIRRVAGRDAPPTPRAWIATLRVLFPRDAWVRGKDVNIELAGDVTITTGGKGQEPALSGRIDAVRGTADVMGKDFVLEHARIAFIGAPARKARLDVLATHTMDDVEKTKINASVSGTIEEPKIALSSDPPLPEDAVASLLVLGTADPRSRPGVESPSLAGRAATFVGNYLTKELRDEVQEIVPVDVFELEPGDAGSAAEGRLRVGKYVAPGLFLSYAHAFGAAPDEGANALRLEYRFHNAWYLISEFTDGARGDVDLVWTREF